MYICILYKYINMYIYIYISMETKFYADSATFQKNYAFLFFKI